MHSNPKCHRPPRDHGKNRGRPERPAHRTPKLPFPLISPIELFRYIYVFSSITDTFVVLYIAPVPNHDED